MILMAHLRLSFCILCLRDLADILVTPLFIVPGTLHGFISNTQIPYLQF